MVGVVVYHIVDELVRIIPILELLSNVDVYLQNGAIEQNTTLLIFCVVF